MRKRILSLVALAALAGCSADMAVRNPFDNEQRTQMAAFAASAQYPANAQAKDDLGAVAVLDRKANTLRVVNPTDQPLRDVKVWLNGEYVQRVDVIPAHGTAELKASGFYNRQGKALENFMGAPKRVELQRDNDLFNVRMSFL